MGKRSQQNYESGERLPDAAYLTALAAQGGDVLYVLTGQHAGPTQEPLTPDERDLLALFRAAPLAVKGAAIRVLDTHSTSGGGQVFNAPIQGGVAGRDVIHKGRK